MRSLQLALVALLAIGSTSSRGDDAPIPGMQFDDKSFGRLPIMFNGRVTDLDHYARNAMLRISGRDTWQDANGKSQPAIAWLLALMTDNDVAQSVPIMFIPHPAVRELLELESPAEVHRVSIQELRAKLPAFQQREAKIMKSETRRTPEDQAILDFADRLDYMSRVLTVFRPPDLTNNESIFASLQQARKSERQAIPFVVPPQQMGGKWLTLNEALILAHVAKISEIKPNPSGVLYAKLIAARQEDDPATFNQVVQDLANSIQAQNLAACPFNFVAPAGWIEQGTPRLRDLFYFGDTRAYGTTVSTLFQFAGPEHLAIQINFFPRGAAPREKIINAWRLSEGLAPLPAEKIRTTPVKVAGQTGWRVDLESPDDLPVASIRAVSVGVSLGDQSWVISCSGPKPQMAQNVATFDKFVESITITSAADAEKWFGLELREPEPPKGMTVILALIPDKQSVWMLQAACTTNEAAEMTEKVTAILKSIHFRPQRKRTTVFDLLPLTWTLPEGWKLEESPNGSLRVISRKPPVFIALEIRPLKTDGDWSQEAIINQWRAEWRLPELPSEQILANSKTFVVEERPIVLVIADFP